MDDWIYPQGRRYTGLKQSMKRSIVKHFARFRHLEINLQVVKKENRNYAELGNNHDIYQLPSKWQENMEEYIHKKSDPITITIEHLILE